MPLIRVLSPVGPETREAVPVPALPGDLAGRTVGFLDNTKPNFDRLIAGLGEILRRRFGVQAVVHRRKANASSPAPPELVAELAKTCDLVLAGSAD
ncbi:MAG TPA: hypothetical protein VNK50_12730 [Calidithermus sp.]|jgi:hypothetical protein|nr:hypothetical protein [Calidithermus sp.]